MLANQPEPTALAGRIDAIAFEGRQPSVVLDWKSDVAPTERDMRDHARQLSDYLDAIGAPRRARLHDLGHRQMGFRPRGRMRALSREGDFGVGKSASIQDTPRPQTIGWVCFSTGMGPISETHLAL
jgi:hypothetical protein